MSITYEQWCVLGLLAVPKAHAAYKGELTAVQATAGLWVVKDAGLAIGAYLTKEEADTAMVALKMAEC